MVSIPPIAAPTSSDPHALSRAIVARARDVARAHEQQWPASRTEEARAAFERSAVEALRAPVLAERSLLLRRIAKVALPRRLRPLARTVVGRIDGLSRRITDLVTARR